MTGETTDRLVALITASIKEMGPENLGIIKITWMEHSCQMGDIYNRGTETKILPNILITSNKIDWKEENNVRP